MPKFMIEERHFRHSGQTDPYFVPHSTVEAETSDHAPYVFAAKLGYTGTVLRLTSAHFNLGGNSYRVSPA